MKKRTIIQSKNHNLDIPSRDKSTNDKSRDQNDEEDQVIESKNTKIVSKLAETLQRRNSYSAFKTEHQDDDMRSRIMRTLNKLKGRMKLTGYSENQKFYNRSIKVFENNKTFLNASELLKNLNPYNNMYANSSSSIDDGKDLKLISNYYQPSIHKLRNERSEYSPREGSSFLTMVDGVVIPEDVNNKYLHSINMYYKLPELRKKNSQKLKEMMLKKENYENYFQSPDSLENLLHHEEDILKINFESDYGKNISENMDYELIHNLLHQGKNIEVKEKETKFIQEEDQKVNDQVNVDDYVLNYLEKAQKRAGKDRADEIEENYKKFLKQSKNILKVLKKTSKAIFNRKEKNSKEELIKRFGLPQEDNKSAKNEDTIISPISNSKSKSSRNFSNKFSKIVRNKTEDTESNHFQELSGLKSPSKRLKTNIPEIIIHQTENSKDKIKSPKRISSKISEYYFEKSLTTRSKESSDSNKKRYTQSSSLEKFQRSKLQNSKSLIKTFISNQSDLPMSPFQENHKENMDSKKKLLLLVKDLDKIKDSSNRLELDKLKVSIQKSLQNSKNILNPVLESLFLTYDKRQFNMDVFKTKLRKGKFLMN